MERNTPLTVIAVLFSVTLIHISCKKEGNDLPTLTTTKATEVTSEAAITGGNITSEGVSPVIDRGVCWGTLPNPDLTGNHTHNGKGDGKFVSVLSGLKPSTTYYVRAYATNRVGDAYGKQIACTTELITLGVPCPGLPNVKDYDGNVYNTVQIGTQCWMKENLKTRHYSNGIPIPNITGDTEWASLSSGARCWYGNDSATYAAIYGSLYNWRAVNHQYGLCPSGWHVPTDLEWQLLELCLGMSPLMASNVGPRGTDEGGKMKETGIFHWDNPNYGATNLSGFTALPGGSRDYQDGSFGNIRQGGNWWASMDHLGYFNPWMRHINYYFSEVSRVNFADERYGFSVRCLRDHDE